jgi:hypothetical protein
MGLQELLEDARTLPRLDMMLLRNSARLAPILTLRVTIMVTRPSAHAVRHDQSCLRRPRRLSFTQLRGVRSEPHRTICRDVWLVMTVSWLTASGPTDGVDFHYVLVNGA